MQTEPPPMQPLNQLHWGTWGPGGSTFYFHPAGRGSILLAKSFPYTSERSGVQLNEGGACAD